MHHVFVSTIIAHSLPLSSSKVLYTLEYRSQILYSLYSICVGLKFLAYFCQLCSQT